AATLTRQPRAKHNTVSRGSDGKRDAVAKVEDSSGCHGHGPVFSDAVRRRRTAGDWSACGRAQLLQAIGRRSKRDVSESQSARFADEDCAARDEGEQAHVDQKDGEENLDEGEAGANTHDGEPTRPAARTIIEPLPMTSIACVRSRTTS